MKCITSLFKTVFLKNTVFFILLCSGTQLLTYTTDVVFYENKQIALTEFYNKMDRLNASSEIDLQISNCTLEKNKQTTKKIRKIDERPAADISIKKSPNITTEDLCKILKKVKAKKLTIENCPQIKWNKETKALKKIAKQLQHLKKLSIDSEIAEDVLIEIFEQQASNSNPTVMKKIAFKQNNSIKKFSYWRGIEDLTNNLGKKAFEKNGTCKFVKKLELNTAQKIPHLSQKTPKLDTLTINGCEDFHKISLPNNLEFPPLSSLTISKSNITASNLCQILMGMKDIFLWRKVCQIKSCNNLDDLNIDNKIKQDLMLCALTPVRKRKSLELSISDSSITMNNLYSLLTTHKITKLTIKNCPNLNWNKETEITKKIAAQLTCLRELSIDSPIADDVLFEILDLQDPNEYEHLAKVSFFDSEKEKSTEYYKENIAELKGKLIQKKFQKSGVILGKELVLTNINLASKTIEQLKDKAEHIQKLAFINCNGLNKDLPGTLRLPKQLQSLNVSGSDISTKNLIKLLKAGPKIYRLDLSNCSKDFWDDFTKDPELLGLLETRAKNQIVLPFELQLEEDFEQKHPLALSALTKNKIIAKLFLGKKNKKNHYPPSYAYQKNLNYLGKKQNETGTYISEHKTLLLINSPENNKKNLPKIPDRISHLHLENFTTLPNITENNELISLHLKNCFSKKEDNEENYYYDYYTNTNIASFFENTKTLQTLKLDQVPLTKFYKQLKNETKNSITHLTINHAPGFNIKQLKKLLHIFPKLTHLTITNCPLDEEKTFYDLEELSQLIFLDISSNHYTNKQIKSLLSKTPNITSLLLKSQNDSWKLPLKTLSKLTYIDLSYTKISLDELEQWTKERINNNEYNNLNPNISLRLQGVKGLPTELQEKFTNAEEIKETIQKYRESQQPINKTKQTIYDIALDNKTIMLGLVAATFGSIWALFKTQALIKSFVGNKSPQPVIAALPNEGNLDITAKKTLLIRKTKQ